MTMHTTQPRLDQDVLDSFRSSLEAAAASRRRQLDDMASVHGDLVVGAQRDSLERILAEIGAAQERLDDDRFGLCQGCGAAIPLERLELRPWAPVCVGCAARRAA
jgi:RNA polymerase-binding transcription factor DksA